jgi:hypothetical protein
LFPGEIALEMALEVDQKMGSLPGLEGIQLMVPYVKKAQEWAREQPDSVKLLANNPTTVHIFANAVTHVQRAGSSF